LPFSGPADEAIFQHSRMDSIVSAHCRGSVFAVPVEVCTNGHPGHYAYVPAYRSSFLIADQGLGTTPASFAYSGMGRLFQAPGRQRGTLFFRIVTRQQRIRTGLFFEPGLPQKMVHPADLSVGIPGIL